MVHMKKLFTFISALLMMATMQAADVTQGPLLYNVTKANGTNYLLIAGVNPSSSADINIVFGKMTYYNNTTQATETGYCVGIDPSASFSSARSRVKSIRSTSDVTEIRSIPSNCFQNCTNLELVNLSTINYTQFEIQSYAFSGCTSLKTVKLPAGMKSIASDAFYSCPITEIQVNIIEKIHPNAFRNCTRLTKVVWANTMDITEFQSGAAFHVGTSPYVTPFSAVKDQITEVIVWYRCTPSLFKYMSNLRTVTFTPDVTEIGAGAFYYCQSLTTVNGKDNVRVYGDQCFCDCSSLTGKVEIKPATTGSIYIGGSAFSGTKITKVVVGDQTSEDTQFDLKDFAFKGCTALTEIELHGTVREEFAYTFMGCTAVKSFYWASNYYDFTPLQNNEQAYVGKGSFLAQLTNLEELNINRKPAIYEQEFYNLKSLKKVTIGKNVQWVGDNAFYGCDALKTVEWKVSAPRSSAHDYTSADKSPFAHSKLTSLEMGHDVRHIPSYTFSGQDELPYIYYGYGNADNSFINVESIGDYAFTGVTQLVDLTFQSMLTYIGTEAFKDCAQVKSIRSYADTPPTLGTDVFAGCNNGDLRGITLYLTSGSENAYKAASGWCEFYGTCGQGIEDVESGDTSVKSEKFIQNGQLYIRSNGAVYDVHGTRINEE